MKINNLSTEKKIKLQKLFSVYIPQGCFVIFALDSALKAKPWFDNVMQDISLGILLASSIAATLLYDSPKEAIMRAFETKIDWGVWLLISLLGVLVNFALDDITMVAWIVFAIGDFICLLLTIKKTGNNPKNEVKHE